MRKNTVIQMTCTPVPVSVCKGIKVITIKYVQFISFTKILIVKTCYHDYHSLRVKTKHC